MALMSPLTCMQPEPDLPKDCSNTETGQTEVGMTLNLPWQQGPAWLGCTMLQDKGRIAEFHCIADQVQVPGSGFDFLRYV